MNKPEYIKFDCVDESEFIAILNRRKIREHLVEHDLFDKNSIRKWIDSKIEMDSISGCRVRAIKSHHQLVGWCGIQFEADKYEIAIVLDESAWGMGKRVFVDILKWAKELEHKEIFIHLLHTRRENKFLAKIAQNVFHSEMYGNKFTTYQLAVN